MVDEQESYDWDYEEDDRGRSKVLWGRIVALVVVLLLVFWLGRATAPAGVDEDAVRALRAEVAEKLAEIDDLEEQLAAQETPLDEPSPDLTASASPGAEGQTYRVKPGETLTMIAQRFYGEPSLDACLATVNDIEDPTQLAVNQELFIPDQCF